MNGNYCHASSGFEEAHLCCMFLRVQQHLDDTSLMIITNNYAISNVYLFSKLFKKIIQMPWGVTFELNYSEIQVWNRGILSPRNWQEQLVNKPPWHRLDILCKLCRVLRILFGKGQSCGANTQMTMGCRTLSRNGIHFSTQFMK